MKVDGIKLLEMIKNGEVKKGDKFKINNWDSIYVLNENGDIKNEATDDKIYDILTMKGFAEATFEILSEEDKEIDIQAIEEICLTKYFIPHKELCENIEKKMNEVIRAIKQLDKKIKE